ncbi:hypothetical protein [Massilia horti]|uniref:Lipoprotein n=1 Tax=Massilia horti TaxID=2562153 RepID=A0A4Y9T7K4_9BURK|nr:hypothetical protein [Massilia horti]TFW34281.1 hypothetical protein E4O92_04365 [Massilia horti]
MTTQSFRTLLAFSFTVALTACGGATDSAPDAPRFAAAVQTKAAADEPQPDCAPERCSGLRIIDGNAEAYRLQAQQRAEAEGGPQA